MRYILSAIATAITFVSAASGAGPQLSIPVQITHSINDSPAPSPDGKRLVYLSVVAGKEQLFLMDVDGSNAVQITRDDADHEDPAWSPDGGKIAFVYMANGRQSIATVDTAGGNLDLLTPPEQKTIHPNWSADSRRIIYCTNDDIAPPRKNTSQIMAIDVASRKFETLIQGGINTYGSWSPDGRHIVFRKIIGEENSEVFVADADGGHPRNLTNNPFFDGWPAWSPDGTQIAFASNRRGHGYQIFIMAADGGNPRVVALTEGRGTAPRWSTDGKSLYFPNCTEKDYGVDCQIYLARLAGP
jgi:TolB protein